MAKKKKFTTSFLIGIFVLTGLALLVGFILWMGATQFFKEYDYYVTYFEDSVGGLENGSSVKYLGVPCGLVHSISIAPDGKLVQIIVKIDKNLKIEDSLVVKLEMAGLAGGKYLLLTSSQNTIVNNFTFDFELPYPLLNSAPSQLDEITQSAGSIIGDLQNFKWKEISDGLTGTLDGTDKFINNKDLIVIIANLKSTTESLNLLVEKLNNTPIIDNIEAASANISKSAVQIEKMTTVLHSQLNQVDIPQYLDKYYTDFHSTMQTANGAIALISDKFQGSMLGVSVLLENLDRTNKNLQTTIRNINDSPYLFLTEPPKKKGK